MPHRCQTGDAGARVDDTAAPQQRLLGSVERPGAPLHPLAPNSRGFSPSPATPPDGPLDLDPTPRAGLAQAYLPRRHGEAGLIQDPRTANTARFHWDPKSWSADPMYLVDSGRPLTGAPPLLKTRRHMKRDAARKLWRKLQEQGWRQVQPQWGADVDV